MSKKEIEYYFTIEQSTTAEYKDRGSKFIAFAFPIVDVDDVKKHLTKLKKEHPKAVHHCYAYSIGTDGNNFRVNDDGEPSGSAGKPIYNQIISKQLCNVLVVVVRYFGGTLLGVPGLINAYKMSAMLALQTVPVVQKPIEINYNIHCDYTRVNDVMTILKQCNATIIQQEQQLFCNIIVGIPKVRLQEALFKLEQLHTIEVKKVQTTTK